MHRLAVELAVALRYLAGVEADPHTYLAVGIVAVVRVQRALDVDRRANAVDGVEERGHEPVAEEGDRDRAVRLELVSDDLFVDLEDLVRGHVAFPGAELRGSLDVGEKDRELALVGRGVAHARAPIRLRDGWHEGHQYVVRACSPWRLERITVLQRRQGRPARP